MSRALYRKYRSRSLDEIVGQDHITQLLRQAIASDAISHAYLLTGPRGVGKTSIARIIAHEINQLPYEDEVNHLDIIEIDAASNNGVEDVRDLREKVHIAPSSARKKVYIIDEVHMLSKAAFNALLKTLEEPPDHVVFILATTDVEKLPQTIISRVQRFNFRAIPKTQIVDQLRKIAELESISVEPEVLERIADYGDGSFRDSIGLLDQVKDVTSGKAVTLNDVNATLGATDSMTINTLLQAQAKQDLNAITTTLNSLEQSGINAKVVVGQLISTVTKRLNADPTQLNLLDELISLNLDRYPYLRLLVALTKDFNPTVKSQTSPADPKEQEIEKQPRKKHKVTKSIPKESASITTQQSESKHQSPNNKMDDFSWQTFINTVKEDAPATAMLLSQSDHQINDTTLTIYAKQAFRAKRLQSAKYTANLNQALEIMGHKNLNIDVYAEGLPSINSSINAVTDIMGGGEEVSIDAIK